MGKGGKHLTAEEAAATLGIQVASLYAYVSRRLLRSEPAPDDPRSRRYVAEDVQRLLRRQAARRNPAQSADPPLAWGLPVMESAITLLEDRALYYRGHDVASLARDRSLEQVAGLLWTGTLNAPVTLSAPSNLDKMFRTARPRGEQISSEEFIPQLLSLLPQMVLNDFNAYDLRSDTVIRQGAGVLGLAVNLVSGGGWSDGRIAAILQQHWVPGESETAALVDAALVLCADHELNASTFTVRCIASTGAPLYSALIGGLSALMGPRHGAASLAVEAMLDEVDRKGDVRQVLTQRLRRGEPLPGFGHRLYPGGDPRAATMIELFEQNTPDSEALAAAREVTDAAFELTGERPNLEFGLVTLAGIMRAPAGTALTIMALGRMVGWVAHALEEYSRDELIRPRARYVGPPPH